MSPRAAPSHTTGLGAPLVARCASSTPTKQLAQIWGEASGRLASQLLQVQPRALPCAQVGAAPAAAFGGAAGSCFPPPLLSSHATTPHYRSCTMARCIPTQRRTHWPPHRSRANANVRDEPRLRNQPPALPAAPANRTTRPLVRVCSHLGLVHDVLVPQPARPCLAAHGWMPMSCPRCPRKAAGGRCCSRPHPLRCRPPLLRRPTRHRRSGALTSRPCMAPTAGTLCGARSWAQPVRLPAWTAQRVLPTAPAHPRHPSP